MDDRQDRAAPHGMTTDPAGLSRRGIAAEAVLLGAVAATVSTWTWPAGALTALALRSFCSP